MLPRMAGRRCGLPVAALPLRRCFRALVVEEPGGGASRRRLAEYASTSELLMTESSRSRSQVMEPPDVELEVLYSTLNYKDAMVVEGRCGVTAGFPIVPGIDLAGRVVRSGSAHFQRGDEVVVTGQKLGQHVDGAFSERLFLPAGWLIARPAAFTLPETMAIGSAGVTAMMCVMHLEQAAGLRPGDGEVVVTGAGGGLGSIAVAILAKLGHTVVASTGRATELEGYLRDLGASRVIGRLDQVHIAQHAANHTAA